MTAQPENFVNILVTIRSEKVSEYKETEGFPDNMPNLGAVFADKAAMKLVGRDAHYSARFAVPADQKAEIMEDIRARGYIAENDYVLRTQPQTFSAKK